MFDPFAVLGVQHVFVISNLDKIYFEKYRYAENKEELNQAYAILKDDIARAQKLCELNGFVMPDAVLPKEMLFIARQADCDQQMQLRAQALVNISKHCAEQDYAQTWYWLQKYSYISRMLQNNILLRKPW